MIVVFRADASASIGGGHVVRCLALARALAAAGASCSLAATAGTREFAPDLATFGCASADLPPGAHPAAEAAALARRFPEGVDWLVVDHYGRDASFEALCRPWASHILVIDDLADRPHDCDLLLDQTSVARAEDYGPLVPAECRLMLGPAYALLRPGFRRWRAARHERAGGPVQRIHVSFGAIDAANLCSMTLRALADARIEAPVDVVIGRNALHRQDIESLAAAMPFPATVHSDVEDMAGLMALADLAIGAAGATSWERCALGLPSVVVVAAENQRRVAAELERRGAALVLGEVGGVSPADVAEAARGIAAAPERRQAMARAALALCDGLGAERAKGVMLPVRASGGRPVWLRPAQADDADLLLRWQADPNTRRFARNPQVPDPVAHAAWMWARLADPDCLLNIVMLDATPAGALRLDRVITAGETDRWEISIYVDPGQYRRGIGKAALAAARRLLPEAVFLAEILPDNAASHSLFAGAGYVLSEGRYVQRPAPHTNVMGRTTAC